MAYPFQYFSGKFVAPRADAQVCKGPEGPMDADQLLRYMHRELAFPDYFGFNWNALDECLSDLSWIKEERVCIVHYTLPEMDDSELELYLSCLAYGVRSWIGAVEEKLEAVFLDSLRPRIDALEQSYARRGE